MNKVLRVQWTKLLSFADIMEELADNLERKKGQIELCVKVAG